MKITQRIHFPETDSTNSWALRELDAHRLTAFPTLVTTLRQTAGRGQKCRTWHSPDGCLMLSLLFEPKRWQIALAQTPLLGFAAALAILETLTQLLPPEKAQRLAIHWPNDVFCADAENSQKFRKLAGLLFEGHASGVMVAGIGLNLLNSARFAPPELQDFMLSLSDLEPDWIHAPALQTVSVPDPENALPNSLERFLWLFLAQLDGFLTLLGTRPAEIVRLTDLHCSQKNTLVTLQTPQGQVTGFCSGLAPDGALLIDGFPHRVGLIHF